MKREGLIYALLVALALTLVSAGPGKAAGLKQSPAAFLAQVVGALAANDYDSAWQTLLPSHQAVAPEAEYVSCEKLSPIPMRLASLVAVSSRPKPVAVAGQRGKRRGVVVTFRLRWADDAAGTTWASTLTAAAVSVDGHWAWLLPRARYDLYLDDACGL